MKPYAAHVHDVVGPSQRSLNDWTRCQQLLPDGLLWVSLGPQPDVHTELLRLTALLHAPEEERRQARNTQKLAHYVRRLIGEKRLLLVIDDAWRVEEARYLLLDAPQSMSPSR